ncbi:MAG TPA: geranylgeranylglyceryl/heptaprenylglyceryl phosphate synthase [Candidatus Marinimicrobia bacterium]|jgi:phosphoglycerol geranylgeranyltransferase|nr:geranylgeranylglyceryl/heptaprenylglyceryl phosphate synthase [Candidatus Neomarinimicrobiota bacterium]HIB02977.1 geranylgeranylglyceryl/heptaprenylglyceryl phosphate synthase [Candidatus Neomarinimicrobiota bacterium]HIB70505.1 geranylgeranylglyceryl/heptaprenylglyceryl phosphate synthase [Candidatus Neomarinimicrobiota bacterium]HIB95799.1 geranylgeranylglyceryl/heptaprenylglyceryl phosphate synthase [Candidatus Neomarinimicrobiota bacterium]HIN61365.1 geranylgeranylglyceryl/heptaprenylgl
MSTVYSHLEKVRQEKGAGYLVLIDPDKKNDGKLEKLVTSVNRSGADGILIGGSLIMDSGFHERAEKIKSMAEVPVILFPGSVNQLGPHCDAVLFMSVISGRNPTYLIGEQVIGAPLVKDLGLEPIPTGYMIFDGGGHSTAEFMSGSSPLPMNRPDIAVAHALAGQYLGMKLIYLEAGSGAESAVPDEIISAVAKNIDIPLIVGGGIRKQAAAVNKVKAGASFIITGTAIESDEGENLLESFADAIHGA